MTDTPPINYKLKEAEEILRCSRPTLLRYHKAGLLVLTGENHARRVAGASLRALAARIEQGEDLWAVIKASENPAPSEARLTAKAQFTKTKPAAGGSSPHRKTGNVYDVSARMTAAPQSKIKPVT